MGHLGVVVGWNVRVVESMSGRVGSGGELDVFEEVTVVVFKRMAVVPAWVSLLVDSVVGVVVPELGEYDMIDRLGLMGGQVEWLRGFAEQGACEENLL